MKKPLIIELKAKLERDDTRISKTKYTTFQICPARYEKIYVDKRYDELVQSPEMKSGELFHLFGKEFFDKVDVDKALPLLTFEDLSQYFETLIPVEYPPVTKECCRNFCRFEAEHFLRAKKTDIKFFFPLEREYLLESDEYIGIIDRIDLLANDTLMNIEYKLSSRWRVQYIKSECVFYSFWLNKIDPFDRKATMIGAYNANLDIWWQFKLTPWSFRGIESGMRKMSDKISKKEFPKRHTSFCRMCEFAKECFW